MITARCEGAVHHGEEGVVSGPYGSLCEGAVHPGEVGVASGDRHIVSIGKKQKDEC